MSPFSKSSGAVGSESSKHPLAVRLFYTAIIAVFGAALLPVIPVAATQSAVKAPTTPSAYTAVTPKRVFDTRDGTGTTVGPLNGPGTRDLQIAGANGVPAAATGVILNVTAVNMTANAFLTVYPTGASHNTSNLNFSAGQGPVANLVESPLSASGSVSFYNSAGQTDVVADLQGYFAAPSGNAGGEVAIAPNRITDTRAGSGKPNAGNTLGPAGTITVQVTGTTGVPTTGVSAAVLNLTSTAQTAPSFFSVYPGVAPSPKISNENWVAGQDIANRVIVPVSATGTVTVYNSAGNADAVVDISGYFTDSTLAGKFFTPQTPVRIADTRSAYGQFGCTSGTLGAGGTCTLQVTGTFAGVPSGATAVIANVTGIAPTAPGFLTVYPSNISNPGTSDVNLRAGVIAIPNLVVATLSPSGAITIYNLAGQTDVAVDLFGYFGGIVSGPAATVTAAANPSSIQANGTSTSTVTATVLDAASAPVAGDTVTFTLTPSVAGACGPLTSTTGITDAAGKVTTTYTSSVVTGTCTVKATETGGKNGSAVITQTTPVNTVTVTCTTPASADATPSTCTVPATGVGGFTIKVTVKKMGVAQNADPILLSSGGSPVAACGTFGSLSGTTDASGVFTTSYTSSTTVGTCNVTALEANTNQTGTATITQTKPKNLITVSCTSPIPASTSSVSSTSPCTANVTTWDGFTPVSGDTVTFSLSGTPPAACGIIAPPSGSTDASGNLVATYTASMTSGFCTVTATESGTGASSKVTIDQTLATPPASTPYTVTVDCSTDGGVTFTTSTCNVPADGVKTVVFRATVKNSLAAAVSGDPISWKVTGPSGCGNVAPAAGFTDASGQETTLYTATLTVNITCSVIATEAFTGATGSHSVHQTAVPDKIVIKATPSSIAADGVSTSTVTATVTDGVTGAVVAGDVITFSAIGNPAGACGSPADSTSVDATTNASGVATITYISSATSGFCTITAADVVGTSADDDTGPGTSTTITQTQSPAPSNGPFTVKVRLLHPDNGLARSSVLKGEDTWVAVQVTDAAGKVVAADPTNFSVGSSGGCHVNSGPNGVTSSHGTDSAEVNAERDLTTPTCTVTVTESQTGAVGSATITHTGLKNAIEITSTSITEGSATQSCGTSGSGDNWHCNTPVATTGSTPSFDLTFKVNNVSDDIDGVANDQVTFTLTGNPAGACGTLVNTTNAGMTNSNGLVTTTYVSSSTVGNCILRATEAATGRHTAVNEADIWISQQVSSAPNTVLNVSCVVDASSSATCNGASPHLNGDGSSTATITATVTNFADDSARAGDRINFLIDDPNGECGTLSVTSAVTDAAGKATTKLTSHQFDGDFDGNITMSCGVFVVEAEGYRSTQTFARQDIPANTVTLTCNGTPVACTLPANGTSTGALVATVKDAITGLPVVGDSIAWTTNADPSCSTTLTPTASQTNSSGQATSTYLSSTTPGFCTITATDPSSNYSSGGSPGSSTSPSANVIVTQTTPPAPARPRGGAVL